MQIQLRYFHNSYLRISSPYPKISSNKTHTPLLFLLLCTICNLTLYRLQVLYILPSCSLLPKIHYFCYYFFVHVFLFSYIVRISSRTGFTFSSHFSSICFIITSCQFFHRRFDFVSNSYIYLFCFSIFLVLIGRHHQISLITHTILVQQFIRRYTDMSLYA